VMDHGAGGCQGSNVYSSVGFYTGSTFPAQYSGAFFFGDVVRGCLWTMFAKPNGDPDPATLFTFSSSAYPVDVKTGTNGDLYYVDIYGGSLHEISYTP
jgi:glucose/arabinose dehydrogenase